MTGNLIHLTISYEAMPHIIVENNSVNVICAIILLALELVRLLGTSDSSFESNPKAHQDKLLQVTKVDDPQVARGMYNNIKPDISAQIIRLYI